MTEIGLESAARALAAGELALVHGDPGRDPAAALVHTHVACLLGDTFGSLLCDCYERSDAAARPFACPAGEPVDPALARGLLGMAGLTADRVAA